MTVLKGDLAARQSKSIIRLFKKEKPFVRTLKRRRSFSAEASSACPCSLSTRWRNIGSTTRMAMKSTLTTATFSKRNTMILNEYLTLFSGPYEEYLKGIETAETHRGYFSVDKKGHKVNSTTKRGSDESDDISAYDLIMKEKELLLSFDNPVHFIFSHSALREGWDKTARVWSGVWLKAWILLMKFASMQNCPRVSPSPLLWAITPRTGQSHLTRVR